MKRLLEEVKHYALVLVCLPLGLVMWLAYVHAVSILDPILTIILGGGFILAVLAGLFNLLVIIKDFVISIFVENKEVDEKGFKKHF